MAYEKELQEPVWKCSWSPVGFLLAVSSGDHTTRVFQQLSNHE